MPTSKRSAGRDLHTLLRRAAIAAFFLICTLIIIYNLRGNSLLKTLDGGEFSFALRGRNTVTEITAYRGDTELNTFAVAAVLPATDDYGVTVTDLNFDGFPDLTIATTARSDSRYYHCWVYHPAEEAYREVHALYSLCNLTVDPETHSLLSTYRKTVQVPGDGNEAHYKTTDGFSVWKYIDGAFREYERRELTYFSEGDNYLYSLYSFDFEELKLSTFSLDDWMTREEGEAFTLDTTFTDPLHSPDSPPEDPAVTTAEAESTSAEIIP